MLPDLPAQELRGWERLIVPWFNWWNTSRLGDGCVRLFLRLVSQPWIQTVMSNRLQVDGIEHVRQLDLDGPCGVLLVGNHRTYFDLYVATSVMVAERGWWFDRLVFPVRSRFFYDHPLGPLVNYAVSAGSMWPPMFSGFGRQGLNARGLAQVVEVLGQPRTLVGLHPEGTRSKGADPLDLLPARGGVGRVAQAAHPDVQVLPFFLSGLGNNLPAEIRLNFRPEGQRGPPLRLSFGAPVRCGDLPGDLRPVGVSQLLLDQIRALGAAQRAHDVVPSTDTLPG